MFHAFFLNSNSSEFEWKLSFFITSNASNIREKGYLTSNRAKIVIKFLFHAHKTPQNAENLRLHIFSYFFMALSTCKKTFKEKSENLTMKNERECNDKKNRRRRRRKTLKI